VTRLTDLIRGQSNQEPTGPDSRSSVRVSAPGDPLYHSSRPSPIAGEIDWYQRACQELQGIKHAVQTKQPWTLDELLRIASGIVASVGIADTLVHSSLRLDDGDYLVKNAVRVAILSVKVAEALRYESADLEQVALAGLLHDIGMFALPDALVYKTGTLAAEELLEMREHPRHGARLFKDVGEAYPAVGRVILQEHERLDGSGYPDRLTHSRIDEMALLIGLADVFEAAISTRPYRRGVSPHRAIRALLLTGKTVFPHHLLKAFVDQLSVYPLGTIVRLNTGETGVVSQLNRQYPLRPILQVSQHVASGHAQASKKVDLRAETSVHIVEVVPTG